MLGRSGLSGLSVCQICQVRQVCVHHVSEVKLYGQLMLYSWAAWAVSQAKVEAQILTVLRALHCAQVGRSQGYEVGRLVG